MLRLLESPLKLLYKIDNDVEDEDEEEEEKVGGLYLVVPGLQLVALAAAVAARKRSYQF